MKIETAVDDLLSAEEGSEKKIETMEFIKSNIREVKETEAWKNKLNGEKLNEIFVYVYIGNGSY